MENNGMSAADVMALTSGKNDGIFGTGSIGIFALIIIFILLFGGNGMFGGNVGQMATADLLYNQSTDAAIRGLAQGQCNLTDTVLNASYNNLSAMKDVQYQISNSIAGLSNQISNQTAAITNMFNEAQIRELSDKLATTRDELSNTRQTAVLTDAITGQTATILNSLGKWRAYPPCYDGCGCSGLV